MKLHKFYNQLENQPLYALNGFKQGDFDHIFLFIYEFYYNAAYSGTGIIIRCETESGCGNIEALDSICMDLFISFYRALREARSHEVIQFIINSEFDKILYYNKDITLYKFTELNLLKQLLLYASVFDFSSINELVQIYCLSNSWHELSDKYSFIKNKFNLKELDNIYPKIT